MKYSDEEVKNFRVWGEFLKYPQCCVEWFCTEHYTERPKDSDYGVADGTGFLPCPDCRSKCNTEQGLYNLLGRDIKSNQAYDIREMYKGTLGDMMSPRYKTIANKYDFDYTEYLNEIKAMWLTLNKEENK